jgi:hypothetical protein
MSGIIDLDKVRELKTRLVVNIDMLQRGLTEHRQKLQQYDKILADPDHEYDQDYMEQERSRILVNIDNINKAIAIDTARSMQCDLEIKAAMDVLVKHGVQCSVGHAGKHDWQVMTTFPSGHWKRRCCRRCDTEERLGSGH